MKTVTAEKGYVNKLVEECIGNIDEKKLHADNIIYSSTQNDYEKICSSCPAYIVLFAIFFIISISIKSVCIYFNWYIIRKYIETTIFECNYHECNSIELLNWKYQTN